MQRNYRLQQGSRTVCTVCEAADNFTENERNYLMELGLSNEAIELYRMVFAHGVTTVLRAGDCLCKLPNGLYRLFYELEQLGLVSRVVGRPVRFRYTAPSLSFSAAYTAKTHRLSEMLARTGQSIIANDETEILIGKSALYERYIPMAHQAQHDMRLYTIGIAYSDRFEQVQRELLDRGVRIRHIIQERRPSNYHILNTWRNIGADIRMLPGLRGFHLMIFDEKAAMVSFSSPEDTENRVTIVVQRHGSITSLISLFESLWKESQPIKWLDTPK